MKPNPKKESQQIEFDPVLNLIDPDQAAAELAKRDFSFFVQEWWSEIVPDPLVWNWHMQVLCDDLQEIGFNLINNKPKTDYLANLPPGSSKSTITSILYPVWLWVLNPELVIISISYSDRIAQRNSLKSRDLLQSERFKKAYPYIKLRSDSTAVSNYKTTDGGERITTSTKGSLTGNHGSIIIGDDLQSAKEASSSTERDLVNKWIVDTLSTRKKSQERTPTIFCQQRLHVNDITGFLLSKSGKYKRICIPAELNKSLYPESLVKYYKDGLYDPIRYSKEVLNNLAEEQGSKTYNTQMLQNPENSQDAILKEHWFRIIGIDEYKEITKEKTPIVYFYADTAYSEKQKRNDPSAILACAKVGDILYILGVSQVWMEFNKLINHIKAFISENGYTSQSKIYIEPKASGVSIVQYLEKQTELNVVKGDDPRDSKITRLNAISPKVEAGKVVIVDTGIWVEKFLSEVTSQAPYHDDQLDCLISAVKQQLINKSNTYGKYSWR